MIDLALMMPAFSDEMQKLAEEKAVEKKPGGIKRQLVRIGALGLGTGVGTLGVGALHGALAQETLIRNKYINMPPAARKRLWRGVAAGAAVGATIGAALQERMRAQEMERLFGDRR